MKLVWVFVMVVWFDLGSVRGNFTPDKNLELQMDPAENNIENKMNLCEECVMKNQVFLLDEDFQFHCVTKEEVNQIEYISLYKSSAFCKNAEEAAQKYVSVIEREKFYHPRKGESTLEIKMSSASTPTSFTTTSSRPTVVIRKSSPSFSTTRIPFSSSSKSTTSRISSSSTSVRSTTSKIPSSSSTVMTTTTMIPSSSSTVMTTTTGIPSSSSTVRTTTTGIPSSSSTVRTTTTTGIPSSSTVRATTTMIPASSIGITKTTMILLSSTPLATTPNPLNQFYPVVSVKASAKYYNSFCRSFMWAEELARSSLEFAELRLWNKINPIVTSYFKCDFKAIRQRQLRKTGGRELSLDEKIRRAFLEFCRSYRYAVKLAKLEIHHPHLLLFSNFHNPLFIFTKYAKCPFVNTYYQRLLKN